MPFACIDCYKTDCSCGNFTVGNGQIVCKCGEKYALTDTIKCKCGCKALYWNTNIPTADDLLRALGYVARIKCGICKGKGSRSFQKYCRCPACDGIGGLPCHMCYGRAARNAGWDVPRVCTFCPNGFKQTCQLCIGTGTKLDGEYNLGECPYCKD